MINRTIIAGNIVNDPERRGTKVLTFTIAVNKRVYRNGEWQSDAHFFNVTKFGTESQINYFANSLQKGHKVTIDGELSQNRWESNGQRNSRVEIIANEIDFFHVQNQRSQNNNYNNNSNSNNNGNYNNNNNNSNSNPWENQGHPADGQNGDPFSQGNFNEHQGEFDENQFYEQRPGDQPIRSDEY